MNLQPLYDLKSRLEHAAIAGTGLLQEDFRLRREVEALAPMGKASPVFGKITAAANQLLAAPPEGRSALLLDVLSLVDAVLYTQGVSAVSGSPVPLEPGIGSYVQIPNSVLQPLIAALTGPGSGRTALIEKTRREHPEYFRDFRVLPHVISALGESYGELANHIYQILLAQGEAIVPLLKEGFDPEGKTETIRRLRLIAEISGKKENDWYLSILPQCGKDVRETVIRVLGLCYDNESLLMDLCKTERGKLRDAAFRALTLIETEESEAFCFEEIKKRPAAVSCLAGVNTELASDLAAVPFRALLEEILENPKIYTQEVNSRLFQLTENVRGKYSDGLDAVWSWIGEHIHRFGIICTGGKTMLGEYSVADYLVRCLMQTILCNSDWRIRNLAHHLADHHRDWFFCCGVLADMAVLSAAEVYEKYAPLISRDGDQSARQHRDRIQILQALSTVRWYEDTGAYCVMFHRSNVITGETNLSARKMDGFDPRWASLLADPGVNKDGDILMQGHVIGKASLDDLMLGWINPGDTTLCETVGAYLYQRILETGDLNPNITGLIKCRWKNWDNLLVLCARKKGGIRYDHVMKHLNLLPIPNGQKAQQLRELHSMVTAGELKVWMGFWSAERIKRKITALEWAPDEIVCTEEGYF